MAFFGGATTKSKSLDDIAAAVEGDDGAAVSKRGKPPALREAGRSNTYEDRTATGAEAAMRAAAAEDEELLMEFEPEDVDVPEDVEQHQGRDSIQSLKMARKLSR